MVSAKHASSNRPQFVKSGLAFVCRGFRWLRIGVTVNFSLRGIFSRTLHDLHCLYSSLELMVKLTGTVSGHFVTLI